MKSKQTINWLILVAFMCTGIYFRGFYGGILTGIGCSFISLALVGKTLAKKAAERVDKRVKDILTNE